MFFFLSFEFSTLQLNLLWILRRNNINLIGHVTSNEQYRTLCVSTLEMCVNTVSSSCVSWVNYNNFSLTLLFTGDLLCLYCNGGAHGTGIFK